MSAELAIRQAAAAHGMASVVFAGSVGTIVEWNDFHIYGTAAALVFNSLFFQPSIPWPAPWRRLRPTRLDSSPVRSPGRCNENAGRRFQVVGMAHPLPAQHPAAPMFAKIKRRGAIAKNP